MLLPIAVFISVYPSVQGQQTNKRLWRENKHSAADRSSQSFAVPRHLNFSVMEVDLSANVASGSNSSCKSAEQLHDIYAHLCLQSDVMKGKRRHVMQHNVDYVCMYVCMHACMHVCVCGWMDGRTDGWMGPCMHG